MAADILQLTDLHLLSDRNARLKGIRTCESLIDVLQFVRAQVDGGEWDFEYLILTGDLAHDEQLETYQLLRELLGDWTSRCRLIPGNHDDRALIRRVFPELTATHQQCICFSVESAGWRLIGLDSHVDGEVHGHLSEQQMDWLHTELSNHASQSSILFLHHPPVAVNSAWLDQINLKNAEGFIELVRSHSQIHAVCAGHVHQAFSEVVDGVRFLTTPSTGVQFLPHQAEPVVDQLPPGVRVFDLDGGRFESRVVRLPDPHEAAT